MRDSLGSRSRFAPGFRVRRIRMEEGSTYLPGTASAEVLLRQGRDHAEVVDTFRRDRHRPAALPRLPPV